MAQVIEITDLPRPDEGQGGYGGEVLVLVARGLTNRAIGRQLAISEATVKTHLVHLFSKLDVTDRTAAVTVAVERV
jgi:DNA-binding NarL/FixJ family response regulator